MPLSRLFGNKKPVEKWPGEGQMENIKREGALLLGTYNFENFIVGPNNRLAYSAALRVAKSPGKAYNPLFIYSGVGLGKTHLINAIGNFAVEKNPYSNVLYTTSERFTNELVNAIGDGSISQFREKYRSVDVLLIDDVQFLANKEGTQEEFFHTFSELYNAHNQIVLTSDRPPKDINGLEERLVSRFGWGVIVDIWPPAFETRKAILDRKAKELKLEVSDEVIDLLANELKNNVRELEGSLKSVAAMSDLMETKPDLETARKVLRNISKDYRGQADMEEKIVEKPAAEEAVERPKAEKAEVPKAEVAETPAAVESAKTKPWAEPAEKQGQGREGLNEMEDVAKKAKTMNVPQTKKLRRATLKEAESAKGKAGEGKEVPRMAEESGKPPKPKDAVPEPKAAKEMNIKDFTAFKKIVDDLLGDLPADVLEAFSASDGFHLYEKVATSKDFTKDDGAFIRLVDDLLEKLPEGVIKRFLESDDYKIYERVAKGGGK